jgi:uncharacterized protein YggU (UPF0235/DUF167 family)
VTTDEVRFAVRLTPRAAADRIDGVVDGVLRCRVTAPPVEGAANAALLRLLARELVLRKGAVRLVGGVTGRAKVVAVDGMAAGDLLARWPGLAV